MNQFRKWYKPVFDEYDNFKVKGIWHKRIPLYKEHCIVDGNLPDGKTYWEECTFWDVIKGKLANLFGGDNNG